MGEIVDLENYRRRLKRKTARSQGVGNRRNPERSVSHGDKPGQKGDPRFGDNGKVGPGKVSPAGNAKIESSDPDTE